MMSPPVVSPVNHEHVSSLEADAGAGRTRSPGSRESMPEKTELRVAWDAMAPQSDGSANSGPAGSSGVAEPLGDALSLGASGVGADGWHPDRASIAAASGTTIRAIRERVMTDSKDSADRGTRIGREIGSAGTTSQG
jgi:hypothetical protein